MAEQRIILRLVHLRLSAASSILEGSGLFTLSFRSPQTRYYCIPAAGKLNQDKKQREGGKWLKLPPFTANVNGSALGKELSNRCSKVKFDAAATTTMTALKWVLRCCPELPRSLVQKLFRLKQVRQEIVATENNDVGAQRNFPKRVAAKDIMNLGDQICLPVTVKDIPAEKHKRKCSVEEINFTRSLVLYEDSSIIVINKPPGMAVQGGIGIRHSLDEVAATCLGHEYSEPPRLVHRLDRDCSGVLVMGRTQTSAAFLHSIFREKTFRASDDHITKNKRILQRRYLALVVGCPRHPRGLIKAALGKVVLDNGKSDHITVVDSSLSLSQHAMTEYLVIKSSSLGFTWLELSPLTGRKHQLRVHCAEVLGTPIVGDYKYGWQAHRKWKPSHSPDFEDDSSKELVKEQKPPFGLNLEKGSICEKQPRLHLHSKEIVLPNVAQVLQNQQSSSAFDLSGVEALHLVAPLPLYMQRSWDITDSSTIYS